MKWLGNYAAYGQKIIDIIFREIEQTPHRPSIIDPMCGTGSLLVEGKRRGISIDGLDANIIQAIQCRAKLINLSNRDFDIYYREVESVPLDELNGLIVSSNWYHGNVSLLLADFRSQLLGLSINKGQDYLYLTEAAFALSLRKNSCHGVSSNPTWLKKGGTLTGTQIKNEFLNAIKFIQWWHGKNYYSHHNIKSNVRVGNMLETQNRRTYDICVTSPPYCNRLDYKRMFGPEHYFYTNIVNLDADQRFMGDNIIRGYTFNENEHNQYEIDLLDKIRSKQDPKNKDYYFKYYSKYFKELKLLIDNMRSMINNGGFILLNVQNSTYKGIEICIDDIIAQHAGQGRSECIYDEHKSHFGNIVKAKTKQKETVIKIRC